MHLWSDRRASNIQYYMKKLPDAYVSLQSSLSQKETTMQEKKVIFSLYL